MKRKGEKIGWAGGWLGGFIWVAILSVVFMVQGKWTEGTFGVILVFLAAACILYFAPWRYPSTPYWKLMLAPYAAFFVSIAWGVWSYGGVEAVGVDWWAVFWVFPLLIPFGSLSRRRWSDFEAEQAASSGQAEPRG
jgi:hypothetical protein